MDIVKIQNFALEHPGVTFPAFRPLITQETDQVRASVVNRLSLNPSTSPLDLVRIIFETADDIPDVSAEDDDFNLQDALRRLGIEAQAKVLINWYRLDNIDEMSLDDLTRYFDDIWYPAADAIDIFDSTLEWIFCVGYSGEIKLLDFNQSTEIVK